MALLELEVLIEAYVVHVAVSLSLHTYYMIV